MVGWNSISHKLNHVKTGIVRERIIDGRFIMLISFTPRLLSPAQVSVHSIWQLPGDAKKLFRLTEHKFYYLEIARLSAQPTVGLALARRGGVHGGDIPASSVASFSNLVPSENRLYFRCISMH